MHEREAQGSTIGAKLRCAHSPLVIYLETPSGLEQVENIEFTTMPEALAWGEAHYPDLPYQP